ncbi:hypothetical protein DFH09DRAFT_1461606 [Mycena vulgaris]|nr:hypothetical protein DFH09DRAFT_1461606 [Mycena vulgaris]
MSAIALLPMDILGEIMFIASSIGEKFALSQVSQLWRNLALDTPLLWSSFTGGASKADCYRVPFILARSGSTTMLHINFLFTSGNAQWPAYALAALEPYVARIETLEVYFRVGVRTTPVLDSQLQFPALKTLRLRGAEYTRTLDISLSAPQLRVLDLSRLNPMRMDSLLVPSLEDVRLYLAGDTHMDTLAAIFRLCPLASRVVLHSTQSWDPYPDDYDFHEFARRPLAPALRELDLRVHEEDLERILSIGFSDVVLETLSACLYNGHSEDEVTLLARVLLPGIGLLLVFECFDSQEIELRDGAGHTRRLQCWNEDSSFEVQDVWKDLSEHYDLHKTVREIGTRTAYWEEYIESFAAYPPQAPDGITLVLSGTSEPWVDSTETPQIMRIGALAKVEFRRDSSYALTLEAIVNALGRLETLGSRAVEICIGTQELNPRDSRAVSLLALQTALAELPGNWVVLLELHREVHTRLSHGRGAAL